MNVVFFGTSSFGLPALEALKSSSHRLLAIVTQPDRPSGRNLVPKASAVKGWAEANGVRVCEFAGDTANTRADELRRMDPDVFVVISFGRLLKKQFLEIPRLAPLNVHASLLPRWRGASPMQSAILAGDPETGVTVMRMVEALDAGDTLLEKRLKMAPDETLLTLEPKLSALGASALLEALGRLESGSGQWTPQNDAEATVCAKIKKEDGHLRWADEARALDRRVRAFVSWPGTYSFYDGKRLLVRRARLASAPAGSVPGRILEAGPAGVLVAAGRDALLLEELQLEGRKAMPAHDFLKGFPLKAGDNLS